MKSKFKVVSLIQNKNRWKSVYRGQYLGCFEHEEDAARAYDVVAAKQNVFRDRLNFPNSHPECPERKPKRVLRPFRELRSGDAFDDHVCSLLSRVRHRCTMREFKLTLDDVKRLYEKQEGRCAYTGKSMVCGHSGRKHDALSIDRIDSTLVYTLVYTPDNIQLTTVAANRAKNNMTHEEFIEMCKMIAEHHSTSI